MTRFFTIVDKIYHFEKKRSRNFKTNIFNNIYHFKKKIKKLQNIHYDDTPKFSHGLPSEPRRTGSNPMAQIRRGPNLEAGRRL